MCSASSKFTAILIFFLGAFKGKADLIAGGYLVLVLYGLIFPEKESKVLGWSRNYNFSIIGIQLLFQFPKIPNYDSCIADIDFAPSCVNWQSIVGLNKFSNGHGDFARLMDGMLGSILIYLTLEWQYEILQSHVYQELLESYRQQVFIDDLYWIDQLLTYFTHNGRLIL